MMAVLVVGAVLAAVPGTSAEGASDAAAAAPSLERTVALLERAELTHARSELQRVIDALEGLAEQDESDARYFYYLGRAFLPLVDIYAGLGDTDTAERLGREGMAHAQAAIRLDGSGNPDAHRLLGDYYGRLREYQDIFGRLRYVARSMKHHRMARAMDPDNVLALIGVGADRLYAPALFGGDVHEAVALFTQAVEMAPSSPLGHVWLGRAYVELEQPALAREHLEKALALEPRSALAIHESERVRRELASIRGPAGG